MKSLQIHIISQQKVTKQNLPVKLVNCLGKVNLLTHILYMFLLPHANHCPAERIIKWPGFFLRRRITLCSLNCMLVLAEYHAIDFRQIYRFRGKLPLTCRQEQKAAFLSVDGVNVVVLLPL